MASGPSTTRCAERRRLVAAGAAFAALAATPWVRAQPKGEPVYLTFDTGHMGIAPFVADTLRKHDVRVTFFAAHERTQEGDGCLGSHWAPWWKARAEEGHDFGSHTWSHAYWRGDLPGEPARFRIRPSAGPQDGQTLVWSGERYCEEIAHSNRRLAEITGVKPLPLFRAPGGKTSPRLLAAARAGGWQHAGWSPAGFLGDELPSETYPNDRLLKNALRDIRPGDVLLAHLGIWSRKDPWAPAVLDPLIGGLKARGLRFALLREHPEHRDFVARKA